ncbi:hypothetical protein [Jeotgalibaca sp. MA1X17-3]|nr:hypothetical protein [Jeotgalibaca sp. MA1X17-3]
MNSKVNEIKIEETVDQEVDVLIELLQKKKKLPVIEKLKNK